ncbi:hypothetical protein [Heyndrickxia sporothermodurans]
MMKKVNPDQGLEDLINPFSKKMTEIMVTVVFILNWEIGAIK